MHRIFMAFAVILAPLNVVCAGDTWMTPWAVDSATSDAPAATLASWDEVFAQTGEPIFEPSRLFDSPLPAVATEFSNGAAAPIVRAQEPSEPPSGAGGDLAAKSQNPISDLVSLPLQSNWDFGLGPDERTRYIGNFQPVVPVKLNDRWNLVNRVIVPFVNLPIDADMRTHGIGDTIAQFYFSPRESKTLIWGVGPSVLLPTASDPALGFQEWGVGVNGVALVSKGPIVAGALMSQIWSVEGSTKPFLFQPFFNYNLPKGWFLTASGEAVADWELPEESRWSIPFGAGVGRVFPVFGQPLNVTTRFAPFLAKPPGGPDWQFRLGVTLLFPK